MKRIEHFAEVHAGAQFNDFYFRHDGTSPQNLCCLHRTLQTTAPVSFQILYDSLLTDNDDPGLYHCTVDWLIEWCDESALIVSINKREEIIFGLPPVCQLPLATIHYVEIKQVSSSKELGVLIDAALSWAPDIELICEKIQKQFTDWSIILYIRIYCNMSWLMCCVCLWKVNV